MEKIDDMEITEEVIKEIETQEKRLERIAKEEKQEKLEGWKPKTSLGRKVKEGKIKDIKEVIGSKILEAEIVDSLLQLDSDLLLIGQSKGKFGGGKRRAWKQTQRKTMEGNIPSFSCMVVVGDKNGHVGVGLGKAKETLPAREKALRNAKLNIIKITRSCGSFDCLCEEKHTVPFKVEGKCGSSVVTLYPAPQGTGLVIGDECKKILRLAGIKDVYSKTFGQTRTTINLAIACIDALKKTNLKSNT
jgi:small subunit ribosomal protein S5